MLEIKVQRSKTDQAGSGKTVVVAMDPDHRICPVRWYWWWMQQRDARAPHLFHSVGGKKEEVPNGITGQTLTKAIQKQLERLGFPEPEKYGSHSCRKTGVTRAFEAGVSEDLLKRHGRWASDAVRIYNQPSRETMLTVSKAIKD